MPHSKLVSSSTYAPLQAQLATAAAVAALLLAPLPSSAAALTQALTPVPIVNPAVSDVSDALSADLLKRYVLKDGSAAISVPASWTAAYDRSDSQQTGENKFSAYTLPFPRRNNAPTPLHAGAQSRCCC